MRNPSKAAEWQEAVNAAHLIRMIADCVMYGLLETDMEINVARCDEILRRGAELGYRPAPGLIERTFGGKSGK